MEALQWLKNKLLAFSRVDYGYFMRNGSMTLMQNAAGLAFSVASSILLVVMLPIATYGIYSYITALIGLYSACTLSGMNTAVAQAAARGQEYALDTAIRIQARWCAILLIPLSAYVVYLKNTGADASFISAFTIAGIAFLTTTVLSPAGAFMFGKGEFGRLASYGAAWNGITLLLLSAVTWHSNSLIVIICVYAIGSVSNAVSLYVRARAVRANTKPPSRNEEKDIFRFGGHLSVINAFSILAEHADKIILFYFLGPIGLAIYSMASGIMDAGKAAIRSVVSVSLPKLSRTTIKSIRHDLFRHIIGGMSAGIALCVAYWIIIPMVIEGIFPQYQSAIPYAQILGTSFIFIIPITYIAYIFHSQKMTAMLYINGIIPNILRIVCYAVSGAQWGIGGIVITRVVLYALTLCINSISMFTVKDR